MSKRPVADRFPLPPERDSVVCWTLGPVLDAARMLIERAGGRPLARVVVDWNLAGRSAGQARMDSQRAGLIRLNPQLFDYPDHDYLELRDTVLHEMAHLCVSATCRRAAPHGRDWRRFALQLGARPRATHSLPLKRSRRSREFAYAVEGEILWVGPIRHRRIQRGAVRYRMRRAGACLELTPAAFTGKSRHRPSRLSDIKSDSPLAGEES